MNSKAQPPDAANVPQQLATPIEGRAMQPPSAKPLNPYGLHAIRVPLGLLRYPGVSAGAKLLYGRLALFRGRKQDGYCHPNLETLATEMRVSVNTIARWMAELTEHSFIKRQRRQRQAAECVFLAHPCLLDSPPLPNQEILDSPILGVRFTNSEGFDSPELMNLYKEENIHGKRTLKTIRASDDAQVGGARAHQEQPAQPSELFLTAPDGEPLFNGRAASQLSRRRAGSGLKAQEKIWFDAWWEAYWLKKDRKRAREAFERTVRTPAVFDAVMAATRAQTPEMLARDPGKRPYGATWLIGERWEDEPDQPAKLPPRKKPGFVEDVRQVIGERIARGEKPL